MKRILFLALTCTTLFAEKTALIFGVTGQDGSYLAELLLEKGYIVHGVKRRSSSFNTSRVDHLFKDRHEAKEGRFFLHYGDATDATNIIRVVQEVRPDEVYNLSAQSHVQVSFELPEYTSQVDGLGTLRILEAIRMSGLTHTRFYQASTSEMFGLVQTRPQHEKTPFYPRSPYGVAKLYAHWITKNYREAYGMFACSGILFNHESPRRGETFVTRKITRAIASIVHGLQDALYLGNLDASRDWGHTKDYVEAMWLMLQAEKPEDYVIATGETRTVREFVEVAFAYAGITIAWKGQEVNEVGYDAKTGKELVFIDPRYFRPAEVDYLCGDATKARTELGWVPRHSFEDLVADMMEHDLKEAKKRALIKNSAL